MQLNQQFSLQLTRTTTRILATSNLSVFGAFHSGYLSELLRSLIHHEFLVVQEPTISAKVHPALLQHRQNAS